MGYYEFGRVMVGTIRVYAPSEHHARRLADGLTSVTLVTTPATVETTPELGMQRPSDYDVTYLAPRGKARLTAAQADDGTWVTKDDETGPASVARWTFITATDELTAALSEITASRENNGSEDGEDGDDSEYSALLNLESAVKRMLALLGPGTAGGAALVPRETIAFEAESLADAVSTANSDNAGNNALVSLRNAASQLLITLGFRTDGPGDGK